jgi:DNA-binding GntR family transcriptional regulator
MTPNAKKNNLNNQPNPKGRTPMFQAAKQTKVFQDVVEQIQDAILDGRLKTGDTLPSERQLKEMFNISRGTLREALRVLNSVSAVDRWLKMLMPNRSARVSDC